MPTFIPGGKNPKFRLFTFQVGGETWEVRGMIASSPPPPPLEEFFGLDLGHRLTLDRDI